MAVIIPDDICRASHYSEAELKQEIAIMLFEKHKITLGKASQLAEMGILEFQHILASRKIPLHYDKEDLLMEHETLKDMGLL